MSTQSIKLLDRRKLRWIVVGLIAILIGGGCLLLLRLPDAARELASQGVPAIFFPQSTSFVDVNLKSPSCLAFSPKLDALVVGSEAKADTPIVVWSSAQRKIVRSFAAIGPVYGLLFSGDGRSLAARRTDGQSVVWAFDGRKPVLTYGNRLARVIALSNDGTVLYTSDFVASPFGTVIRRTTFGNATVDVVSLPDESYVPLLLSPDGKTIVLGLTSGIKVFDIAAGAKRALLSHPRNSSTYLAATQSFHRCASSNGTTVRVWNLITQQMEAEIQPAGWEMRSLAFSPVDDRLLAIVVGAMDMASDSVLLCDASTGNKVAWLKLAEGKINRISFSANGRFLATAIRDPDGVRVWKLDDVLGRPNLH
jgi:WD40 repeat protein